MTPESAQLIRPREAVAHTFAGSWHATPNNVARARRAVLANLAGEDLGDEIRDAIGVAVTEVATDVVYHAYVGRRIGQFQIAVTVGAAEITISVEDDGCGFDPQAPGSAGRGLAFAAIAGRVETGGRQGGGTVTTVSFDRSL